MAGVNEESEIGASCSRLPSSLGCEMEAVDPRASDSESEASDSGTSDSGAGKFRAAVSGEIATSSTFEGADVEDGSAGSEMAGELFASTS